MSSFSCLKVRDLLHIRFLSNIPTYMRIWSGQIWEKLGYQLPIFLKVSVLQKLSWWGHCWFWCVGCCCIVGTTYQVYLQVQGTLILSLKCFTLWNHLHSLQKSEINDNTLVIVRLTSKQWATTRAAAIRGNNRQASPIIIVLKNALEDIFESIMITYMIFIYIIWSYVLGLKLCI